MTLEEFYYGIFIQENGDQKQFFDTITNITLQSGSLDAKKISDNIAQRSLYLNTVVNGPVHHCTADLLGTQPGTVGTNLLERITPSEEYPLNFVEWMGDLLDYNNTMIMIDDYHFFQRVKNSWIKDLAKEYEMGLISVCPTSEIDDNEDAKPIGAEYAVLTYNPKRKKESVMFGTKRYCWWLAAQLSKVAFAYGDDKENVDEDFAYFAAKNIAPTNLLAVIGTSGSQTNLLIKSGWHLVDMVEDLKACLKEKYKNKEGK